MPKKVSDFTLSTTRLEAFSDGVFAIAITLLILEIKIPHLADLRAAGGLRAYLLQLWPSYVAYTLSFYTIGVFWANHHYLFRLFHRTTHRFLLLNIFFLMSISFLPFPTAVLGDLLMSETERGNAVSFYALGSFLPVVFWFLMWKYAVRYRLIDPRLSPVFIKNLTNQYLISQVFYLLALVTSFFSTALSIAITLGLTLLYTRSPRKPEYLATEPKHVEIEKHD